MWRIIMEEYHGIIIDLSQRNNSILMNLDIIGRKKFFNNLVSLLKVRIPIDALEETIQGLQSNMRKRLLPFAKGFYFHLYSEEELIVAFKEKVFRTKPEPNSFGEIIEYGKTLGIPEKQLDFIPYRIHDETY
jgi:hypothetical protein